MSDKKTYYYRTDEGDYIPMSSFEYFTIFRPCKGDVPPVINHFIYGAVTVVVFILLDLMYLHTGICG